MSRQSLAWGDIGTLSKDHWSFSGAVCATALQEEQGLVSLHRACCHHKLCSVLHKDCGENVVWGLLLGFSSVGEVWDAWQVAVRSCVCAAAESAALQHVEHYL